MRRVPYGISLLSVCLFVLSVPVAAHGGGYYGRSGDTTIPLWLTAGTGGIVVVFSFLFTTAVTDEELIRQFNGWRRPVTVSKPVRRGAKYLARSAGLVALVGVVVAGIAGPTTDNAAVVVVWAGWWAGYTMSVYLVGNTWPLLNPWRTLANAVPRVDSRSIPGSIGVLPSVGGLLILVWLETASSIASQPRLLALAVIGYTAVTVAGASLVGPDDWYSRVDPISRVFHWYGRIAPIQRTNGGLSLHIPTTNLVTEPVDEQPGEIAFVIALLWATTYDGLVTTPVWSQISRSVVTAGVPPDFWYLFALLSGFVLFLEAYRHASRAVRTTASTYVSSEYIARWFAPSLLPIAAGYHLAHYVGYFIARLPALVHAVTQPFAPVVVPVVVLPDYIGFVQIGIVVTGHLLAVWIAHARGFELFPGAVKSIRSQYPFVLVMSGYTAVSIWIVGQPFVQPPYV